VTESEIVNDRTVLRAGALELQLAPAIGGAIARFDRHIADGVHPLMRPAEPGADAVLAMASFPLVPYANRIRDGRFVCDGRTVTLTPNLPGDPSPLHGQGWTSAWTLASADETSARMTFTHAADEWLWDYESWQDFALDPDGLSLTLGCRNLSPEPMPCGLALHPYFPCDADTVVDIAVAGAWTIDEKVLPVERVAAEGRYALSNRAICGADLDNGFDGWTGPAHIRWRNGSAIAMSSTDADCFQVYAPPAGQFFAAEPVQNVNAALNAPQADWLSLGIAMLAQREARTLTVRFDVA